MAAFGQTRFTPNDANIEHLLLSATRDLLISYNLDASIIDCVLVSTNDAGRYLGAILSEMAGIKPRISHTIESMCSSGGISIMSAYSYIKSGLADVVLVAGAERAKGPGGILEWDVTRGQFCSPIYWGSIMSKAYKREYSISSEQIAAIPAKNRTMATDNPYAANRNAYSILDILESKEITTDLRLLECSQACTGASAILLASEDVCRNITDTPIWIEAVSQCTLQASFGATSQYHAIPSARQAAQEAYRLARISSHQVDVVEVHDAFAVCEPMILEALDMAHPGKGAELCENLYKCGSRKTNPRGGLLGMGHPFGATGISQAGEVFLQLQGKAERRQTDKPSIGLTQGMSAAGTTSVVMVMKL